MNIEKVVYLFFLEKKLANDLKQIRNEAKKYASDTTAFIKDTGSLVYKTGDGQFVVLNVKNNKLKITVKKDKIK